LQEVLALAVPKGFSACSYACFARKQRTKHQREASQVGEADGAKSNSGGRIDAAVLLTVHAFANPLSNFFIGGK
jgi:hypothetical protein